MIFTCPVRRNLRPIQFTDFGKIKRIRGLAYPGITYCCHCIKNVLHVTFPICCSNNAASFLQYRRDNFAREHKGALEMLGHAVMMPNFQ